jgi:hypothetical protein
MAGCVQDEVYIINVLLLVTAAQNMNATSSKCLHEGPNNPTSQSLLSCPAWRSTVAQTLGQHTCSAKVDYDLYPAAEGSLSDPKHHMHTLKRRAEGWSALDGACAACKWMKRSCTHAFYSYLYMGTTLVGLLSMVPYSSYRSEEPSPRHSISY